MEAFYGRVLINRNGEKFNAIEILQTKNVLILLFASSRCPRIKELLSLLEKVYAESFKHRCGFEIILISSEKTPADFDNFFRQMNGPWYAIPFDEPGKMDSHSEEMRWRFGITSIPFVVVIKQDGSYISRNALEDLENLGIDVVVAWSE